MALEPSRNNRVDWIDAARGIGIVLVVIGHVERGLVSANIAEGPIWSWIDYSLYTFHMPLFFVLAGVNVPASLAKGQRHFLLSKLQTIAWPYILWSLIQGSALVALSSVTNGHADISDLLQIGWQPMSQFWFLYVLMACQLAALVLAPMPRLMAAIAVATLLVSWALPQGGIVEEFCHALPFFTAGILLSKSWMAWPPGGDGSRAGLAAIGLAIAIPITGRLGALNFDAPPALAASILGILMLVSVSRLLRGSTLGFAILLGRLSMSIYVMHILAAAGTRIALLRLHIPGNPWFFLVICTATGIVFPVIAHRALDRMRLLPILGLAPFRRAPARLGLLPKPEAS